MNKAIFGLGIFPVIAIILIISTEDNPWKDMTCQEMFDFSQSARHQILTSEEHTQFHKYYDPCVQQSTEQAISSLQSIPSCLGNAQCFIGNVTQVIDGDTIKVDDKSIRFSLSSTPELDETGGLEAKSFVETICPVGTEVVVDEDDGQTEGSFGRIIAVVHCSGINVNQAVLESDIGSLSTEFCSVSEFSDTDWAMKYGC